jgi:hypothetical protein
VLEGLAEDDPHRDRQERADTGHHPGRIWFGFGWRVRFYGGFVAGKICAVAQEIVKDRERLGPPKPGAKEAPRSQRVPTHANFQIRPQSSQVRSALRSAAFPPHQLSNAT